MAYNGGYSLADQVSASGNYNDLNSETANYYQRITEVQSVYNQIYGKWWETTPPKPKKPSLPSIVIFVKNLLGL